LVTRVKYGQIDGHIKMSVGSEGSGVLHSGWFIVPVTTIVPIGEPKQVQIYEWR